MRIRRLFWRFIMPLLLCAVPLLSSAGDLRIAVLSVGSGDSSVIVFPNNKTMLIDTGVTNETINTVIPFLRRHGITRLDYFLGTHVHPDHTDGIPVLQSAGFIDSATTVWDWNTFDIYDSFTLEGTSWLIYNARDTAANGTDANYNSVSYRMEYNGFVYSGTGDEGTISMNRFLKDYPNLVPAHVRNTAHHGYGPTSSAFLTKLKSKLYIVSCSTACTSYSAYKTIGTVATQVGGVRTLTATCYNGGRGHVYVRAASSNNWSYQMYATTAAIPGFFALPPNDAQFVTQSAPSSMVAGKTTNLTVRMKNTGSAAWSAADAQKLGSQNPQGNTTWGLGRVDLPAGVTVAAGQEYTFSFNITAPKTPGTYNFQWKMVDDAGSNVGWFGGLTANKQIAVSAETTNQVPYFTSNPFSKPDATVGVAYNEPFSGKAVDPEGGTTTFSKVSGPVWLSVTSGGNATGTPGSSDVGTNSFMVKVTDNGGLSATANMTIKVNAATNPLQTVTFTAVTAEDGYVSESTEPSNIGGSLNATGTAGAGLRIGDTTSKQQIKSVVSFDTSALPDGAVITAASLKMMRGAISGTPTSLGAIRVDIKGGSGFNNATALTKEDFQAAADAANVATMSYPTTNGMLSTGNLSSTGLSKINKIGKTQLRVYFATDDDNDATSDYLGFYPAENGTAANRPVLQVSYQ